PCFNLGRLNPNGTLDGSFNPAPEADVLSLAVQADGKILVGGWFTGLGGQPRSRIGRLNVNGTLDTSFNPGATYDPSPNVTRVESLAVQADGRILVGGWFTTLGGRPRNHLARLKADGTLDTDFNPGADSDVLTLAVQADKKIMLGGNFTR